MLSNGNNSMAFNDFSEMPYIPYKIITAVKIASIYGRL